MLKKWTTSLIECQKTGSLPTRCFVRQETEEMDPQDFIDPVTLTLMVRFREALSFPPTIGMALGLHTRSIDLFIY